MGLIFVLENFSIVAFSICLGCKGEKFKFSYLE